MTDTTINNNAPIEKGLVSVIMPFYNSELTLKRAIELVLRQSYRNLELLVVDDGSTDNSGKICESAAAKDSRVRVFHTPHVGTSTARNIALDAVRGEYVALCDSDDWMPYRAIEKMVSIAERDHSDFVCGGLRYQYIRRSKTYHPAVSGTVSDRNSELRTQIVFSILQGGAAKLYRREIIEAHQIRFVPEIRYAEDADFANRYIAVCDSLSAIPDVVYVYNRMSGASTCNQYMRHVNADCAHAVEAQKMALGRTEYSDYDLQKINSAALGRLLYSTLDYVSKCYERKAFCLELLAETWEMFRPIIDPNLFSKKDLADEGKLRTYMLFSQGDYEGVYQYWIKRRKFQTDRPAGFQSHPHSKRLIQRLHFRFVPALWRLAGK